MQNKIVIDKKTYFIKHFSEGTAKTLEAIQFTERQIEELKRMITFLERSKNVILQKLDNQEY